MKIVHLCLCGPYNDNWGYQENIIPKYHKMDGNNVTIITSTLVNSRGRTGYEKVNPKEYLSEEGVKIIRIPFKKKMSKKYTERLRTYEDLTINLEKEKPDLIFMHGLQFLDVKKVVNYMKKHPNCKLVADNHADFSNSAKGFLSKNVLHRMLWKRLVKEINPYVSKFYGVLPSRVNFLLDMYNTPKEKTELLVMGADDEKINYDQKDNIRIKIRTKYNIKNEDILVISGGKIDPPKRQILNLMRAIKKCDAENIKLLVFGSVTKELQDEVASLADGKKVHYIGWVDSNEVYDYFLSSDLGVFPGRHSVLWEQAVGTGLPCLFKYWEGTTHVDLAGNCEFLYEDSVEEIYMYLQKILIDSGFLLKMKKNAVEKGILEFSYKEISQRSIRI